VAGIALLGGVDVDLLARGSEAQVRGFVIRAVLQRLRELGAGGNGEGRMPNDVLGRPAAALPTAAVSSSRRTSRPWCMPQW